MPTRKSKSRKSRMSRKFRGGSDRDLLQKLNELSDVNTKMVYNEYERMTLNTINNSLFKQIKINEQDINLDTINQTLFEQDINLDTINQTLFQQIQINQQRIRDLNTLYKELDKESDRLAIECDNLRILNESTQVVSQDGPHDGPQHGPQDGPQGQNRLPVTTQNNKPRGLYGKVKHGVSKLLIPFSRFLTRKKKP